MSSSTLRFLGIGLFASAFSSAAIAALVGPTPYTGFADSPFKSVDFSGGYFHLGQPIPW